MSLHSNEHIKIIKNKKNKNRIKKYIKKIKNQENKKKLKR